MELLKISSLQSNCLDNKNEQMNLFQFIVSSMSEGVLLLSIDDLAILYANPKLEKMFGYERDELTNKPYAILNSKFEAEKKCQATKERLAKLNQTIFEMERVRKDGSHFWTRSRTCQIEHPKHGLVIVSVVEDITLLKEAQEREHLSIINKAYEAERSRISRELHDELGQTLTVLKMDIFDLKKQTTDLHAVNIKVVEIENSVNQLIKKVRTIAQDLRPTILANYGVEDGVRHLVNDLKSKTGIDINLNFSLHGNPIDHEIATALFRILQEALTNTLRHSHSEKVDVNLAKTGTGYSLIVRDYDDRDFEISQNFGSGLGITGMRERALALGGDFSIQTDGGVIVKVEIPERVRR